jgi:Ca-activated chloride channel family protein
MLRADAANRSGVRSMKQITFARRLISFARQLFALVAISLLFAATHAVAQQSKPAPAPVPLADDEVETVSTSLVTVPVRVSDRGGRFITDLRREQFHVFEDHVEQEISFFETADKPFTVALLLDVSDSARIKRGEIQAAARAFVDQLRADDRVMIVAFDKNVSLLSEATGDREVLYEAISRAQSGGGTSFYDALAEVVGKRLSHVAGRKAVVVLTDGVDTTSRASEQVALRVADESDALFYAVQYDTISDAQNVQPNASQGGIQTAAVVTARGEPLSVAYKRATLFLRLLADKTGGRLYYADSPKRLSENFARVAAELREQYSLGYYPKNRAGEGKRRKLKVTVDAAGAVVRTRAAYVFKPRRISRGGDSLGAAATLFED